MQKIKYCPVCRKQCDINQKTCECGYEFVQVEEKVDATVVSSNTKVIVDNVPLWIWSFLSFITLSILGWIYVNKFKEDYPERAKSAKKGAIAFYITAGVCLLIYAFYAYLASQGKIV